MLSIDFPKLIDRANGDAEFKIAARYWDGRLQLVIGDQSVELAVVNGEIAESAQRAPVPGIDVRPIRIAASEKDWEKLLSWPPPAGWHSVSTANGFALEGNLLDIGPYNMAIRRLVDLMTEQVNGAGIERTVPDVDRTHDDAIGRYVYVKIDGVQYRVYYEETGSGIPLVLQHTAGADGRQWRHVLEEPEYQRNFRMISYDLPYHGKSLPPTSTHWWEQEYKLTRSFLMETVVAISKALDLERPAYMGCSIGGLLAPDLAFYHPDEFRSVIGINAALALPIESESQVNEQLNSWYHPRVSNDSKASTMLGVMSPTSPEAYRRETSWVYSQGAPPTLKGDVFYYLFGHDLTAEQARQIDTSRVDVYLLTGEYDPLALNGGTEELAACIPGSQYQIIPGAGHFGPSENPEDFKSALSPVLRDIAEKYR